MNPHCEIHKSTSGKYNINYAVTFIDGWWFGVGCLCIGRALMMRILRWLFCRIFIGFFLIFWTTSTSFARMLWRWRWSFFPAMTILICRILLCTFLPFLLLIYTKRVICICFLHSTLLLITLLIIKLNYIWFLLSKK